MATKRKKALTKKRRAQLLEDFYANIKEICSDGELLNSEQLIKRGRLGLRTKLQRETLDIMAELEGLDV